MGKYFYGSHKSKEMAMKIADDAANAYRKGKCYTPSFRIPNSCNLNESTGIWTCVAHAHHHWGSCNSRTFTSTHQQGTGTEWGPISIPIPLLNSENEADEKFEDEYTDANPEDYFTELSSEDNK
ncbi:hypothetical protein [Epilithonimonas hispanica]|uniref:Uncharacterized protein n=1 Tax=Epilithonimonas hispanica TaxID=358687 RepID=A0A3D9CIA7_9FLAO|nr:hypothetical protein [Epilithonimonas hispanica]REC65508.1 hypothetical protein DRF58_17885 [Epilithonimonas hispanica]